VFDGSAWDLPRIHDGDGGGDDGGDDDGDVLAEGVSSHFVCTATHRRTDKSNEQTCCKSRDIHRRARGRSFKSSLLAILLSPISDKITVYDLHHDRMKRKTSGGVWRVWRNLLNKETNFDEVSTLVI